MPHLYGRYGHIKVWDDDDLPQMEREYYAELGAEYYADLERDYYSSMEKELAPKTEPMEDYEQRID